jgi:hypothetical protein
MPWLKVSDLTGAYFLVLLPLRAEATSAVICDPACVAMCTDVYSLILYHRITVLYHRMYSQMTNVSACVVRVCLCKIHTHTQAQAVWTHVTVSAVPKGRAVVSFVHTHAPETVVVSCLLTLRFAAVRTLVYRLLCNELLSAVFAAAGELEHGQEEPCLQTGPVRGRSFSMWGSTGAGVVLELRMKGCG